MRRLASLVLCVASLMVAAPASADAVVHVHVRNAASKPVDGRVSLKPVTAGKSFGCSTSKGACTIRSVPGGRYIVTFQPSQGAPTAPRKVMIPPSGDTDLHISAK